jgi:hypothetical protein
MNSSFDRLNLVNTYGAFGSVGKIRTEIIIMGCTDQNDQPGQICANNQWSEYEFICKPGNINRRPCIRAPYHHRLDWQVTNIIETLYMCQFYLKYNLFIFFCFFNFFQLWFAGFQRYEHNPWLIHLCAKLLFSDQFSPINSVLSFNPFPETPPKYIKIDLFEYHFTK